MRSLKIIFTLTLILVCTPILATRSVGILEQFEYAELVLAGTGKNGKEWIACFRNEKGEVFIAKKGDALGKVFGTIDKINDKGIFVKEMLNLNFTEWYERKLFWPIVSVQAMRTTCTT